MRIVITGATGFIGRNLVSLFLEKGEEVFAVVRPKSEGLRLLPTHPNLHLVYGSLETIRELSGQISRADAFFHLAWGGVNREEIDSPAVQAANVAGSLDCLRTAKELGCTVFMDAGSRVEYGRTDGLMTETLDCHPINEYGKAKWEFYQKAAPLAKELGIHYFHLRFFSVYGWGDHPWSIISTLVRELPKGETVSLSACMHRWNFMYIADAAEAVWQLYESLRKREKGEPASAIVNVAGEDTRVLRSFVEEIHRITGEKGRLEYGSFVQAKEGALSVCPDVSRLKELTGGFVERYTFEQGIREMLRCAKERETENR